MSHLIKFSLQYLTTKEDLANIQAFFKDKDTRRFKLTIEQVYDSIQASINWLERDQEDVNQVRVESAMLARGAHGRHGVCVICPSIKASQIQKVLTHRTVAQGEQVPVTVRILQGLMEKRQKGSRRMQLGSDAVRPVIWEEKPRPPVYLARTINPFSRFDGGNRLVRKPPHPIALSTVGVASGMC